MGDGSERPELYLLQVSIKQEELSLAIIVQVVGAHKGVIVADIELPGLYTRFTLLGGGTKPNENGDDAISRLFSQ